MGLFKSIGGFLNDITGATSAQQSQNSFNYRTQKEFAQNAHQWEMADLEKAGLNPALTATGGSGASASGGGAYASGGGGDIFGALNAMVGMANQTRATTSQNNLNDAQAILAIATAKNIPQELRIKAFNALSERINANANRTNAQTNKQKARGGKASEYLGTEATEGILGLFGL